MEEIAPYEKLTHQEMILLVDRMRGVMIRIGIVAALFSIGGYYAAETVLKYLQQLTRIELVAYGLGDIFFSYLKLALALGLAASMPYAFFALLSIIPSYYPQFTRHRLILFWLAAVFLFLAGILFCIAISLPYGIQFLLSFETSHIAAAISVKKFVSFCLLMALGFGIVFELPLAMILLARIGLVRAKTVAAYRRYAVLAVFITAAIITPTPDIFNMLLMALPQYLLFELGLVGMYFVNRTLNEAPPHTFNDEEWR